MSFLRDRRAQKRIGAITAGFVIVGLLYVLLAPRWYRSVVTVVPAKSQKGSGLSSMLSGELGGLAAGLADGAMGVGADVQRIVAVLQSNDVSDAVIAKFDLKKRYDEKYQETTREVLWRHCDLKALPKPGLVQLSCEDTDPRFVQQLLGFFADYGNQVFRRVGVSSASEQVRFLDKRVGELRLQADQAAAHMRDFQEKYQIVDLETQTKAVVGAMASLNSQRISKQLELEYAQTFSSGDEATTRQLESQLSVVDRKLRSMEEERPATPLASAKATIRRPSNGMFPAALTVPKLRAEFETLYRDRKVAEATLIFALERLEAAKADEARDTSTFLVLDPPALPTRPTRPKRLATAVLALLLGLGTAVAFEWWSSGRGRAPSNSVAEPVARAVV
ncbi:Wzz/FepE/Etk N-terminal domain-containing protein [Anaeromyxobacter diazotrophicus]|uniref:Wzz/FepE/Etk N-terminal domain-containing protein n=1 Tax=Anaeromyxobacter diazotrophicus TaxID=2590199 RepID=UPI001592AD05|nr:Wzz/FepE/Etk N-terminal domain-containing protein [Anaeromyxobacter diazotrophicus]